eukprot:530032-Pelagomonas_calceolata.AAC.5
MKAGRVQLQARIREILGAQVTVLKTIEEQSLFCCLSCWSELDVHKLLMGIKWPIGMAPLI